MTTVLAWGRFNPIGRDGRKGTIRKGRARETRAKGLNEGDSAERGRVEKEEKEESTRAGVRAKVKKERTGE